MDGENHGKPGIKMDDLGGKPTIFGNTHMVWVIVYTRPLVFIIYTKPRSQVFQPFQEPWSFFHPVNVPLLVKIIQNIAANICQQ